MKGKLGVICGGSGSSKFVRAMSKYASSIGQADLQFIANVADDFWYHGLFVCPDIDILTYALSGDLDVSKGWGVKDDHYTAFQRLSTYGRFHRWFNLGDADLALSLRRTELLSKGWKLSAITDYLAKAIKAPYSIIPATDDFLQTFVRTLQGVMHLQEYWVKNSGDLRAMGVNYVGLLSAIANSSALKACSEKVMICPANPVSSVLPIVKLKGFGKELSKSRVLAISPFVSDKSFSGPASKLMTAIGVEANSFGVAKLYAEWLDIFFLDTNEDPVIVKRIQDLGIECVKTRIRIETESDHSIAKEIIAAF